MNTIEIICTLIGAVAAVLGGVWFILQRAIESGMNKQRLNNAEQKINDLPCEKHNDNISQSNKQFEELKGAIVGITTTLAKNDLNGMREDISGIKSLLAQNKLSEMREDISGIKLLLAQNNLSGMREDISGIKSLLAQNNLSGMREDIFGIKSVLVQKFPSAADVFSLKKSPRRLNDFGIKLYQDIKGSDFINENKEYLFAKIDREKPKTALDVEIAANLVCMGFTGSDEFNRLKSYIYNAPSLTIKDENGQDKLYDIALTDVCFVLSIPLRDQYLESHPNIIM